MALEIGGGNGSMGGSFRLLVLYGFVVIGAAGVVLAFLAYGLYGTCDIFLCHEQWNSLAGYSLSR